MGRPIMIILSIVFGMALLPILYVAFSGPIHAMGSTIMAKSGDILKNTKIDSNGSPSKREYGYITFKYFTSDGIPVGHSNFSSQPAGTPFNINTVKYPNDAPHGYQYNSIISGGNIKSYTGNQTVDICVTKM